MTKDDIIRLAREAFGAPYSSYLEKRSWDINDKQVERFAALVAAAEREKFKVHAAALVRDARHDATEREREACAKVCESLFDADDDSCDEAEKCADAIRARGNK